MTSTSSPLFTGTPQQSTPRCGPPAQPCWPVCRGPRTPPANTWPARPRAWSCASVSDTPSPQPWPLPFPLPAPGPGAGILRDTPSSPRLGPWQGSSQAGKAVPIPACPLTASLGGWGPSLTVAPTPFAWLTPTGRDLPPQQPPLATYQHWDPNPSTSSVACHMPCLSVSAESRITGKQTCLTLGQRRFEPCGSTYTWIFFSSERYSTPGSALGGGTEDVEGQL